MDSAVTLIQEVGFPIAAAIGLGWFIYKLVIRIVDGMEAKLDTVDGLMNLVVSSIETIFDEDNVYNADEETKEDLEDFVESFGSEQFKMIQEFFLNVPAMVYEDKFNCKNCQHENTISLKGLQSFFT